MRKAFKFIAEKNDVSIKKTSVARIFFDDYFSNDQSSSQNEEFSLGKETYMNNVNRKFLIKVFSNPKFLSDYK